MCMHTSGSLRQHVSRTRQHLSQPAFSNRSCRAKYCGWCSLAGMHHGLSLTSSGTYTTASPWVAHFFVCSDIPAPASPARPRWAAPCRSSSTRRGAGHVTEWTHSLLGPNFVMRDVVNSEALRQLTLTPVWWPSGSKLKVAHDGMCAIDPLQNLWLGRHGGKLAEPTMSC
jgi:hypothetical protein